MKVFLFVFFATFAGFAGDWPQWLGPTRDAHAAADEKISAKLSSDLKPLWKISVGGGFSSPVVSGNQLVYCDEDGKNEIAHLLDAKTGKEIWRTPLAERFEDEWGAGTRSTPFFDGDRVYAQSCDGEFRCLNRADGKMIWRANFEKNFGVKFLGRKANEGTSTRRGHNGSGILDGDAVIVPVGNPDGATVVCFDKLTGKVLWKSGQDETAYSSIQIATVAGTKQVILFAADALCGFARADGQPLWRVPLRTNAKRHAATPVIFGDNVIVNSHTIGLVCFKISRGAETNSFAAAQLWTNKNLPINLATPVLVKDKIFSYGADRDFVCVDAKTGKLNWSHSGFGEKYSSTLLVGNQLLVLTDGGELVLLSANPEKYSESGRAQVCGKNWNFPALADGQLYIRDARSIACHDLR